jgi:hypothetical protein
MLSKYRALFCQYVLELIYREFPGRADFGDYVLLYGLLSDIGLLARFVSSLLACLPELLVARLVCSVVVQYLLLAFMFL